MIYTLLWNIRLWLKGLMIIAMIPFVLLWIVLIDIPIEFAKDFEHDRK